MKTVMYTINIKRHRSREEITRRRADAIFTTVSTVLMVVVLALACFGLGAMLA